jgi:hypothetical protein
MTVAAGDTPSADALNDPSGMLIAFLERATVSGTITNTPEIPILRGDAIPVASGRSYTITATPTVFASSIAGDLLEMKIRFSLAGAATIASTHLGSLVTDAKTAGGSQKVHGAVWLYTPASTGNLSILVSGIRTGGSGNCTIGSASSAYMLRILVSDTGLTVADSGVDL